MKSSTNLPGERDLFLQALELPPAERPAFLDRACVGRPEIRKRVEALLENSDSLGSFLDQPALAGAASERRAAAGQFGPNQTIVVGPSEVIVTEKSGDRIGPYKILQQIGEGGCGVVYMAEQESPVRRRVALKIIKLGMDTKTVIARFEAERQALAMMDHPNIARVFDAGCTDTGRPYFVMELVRGIRITDYCDQNHVPPRGRLELFITVCHAIQHAHQKGVIHRDIKPSNILVTLHDGHPVPKVIDFGIAKATDQRLTDKTLFTEFQAFIGTPAYMSPEQAEMSGLDIDTRSDIYSLGVLLYQLLTGKTPFDAETLLKDGLEACRKTIREQDPPRPSTRLATLVDAELSTVASQRQTESARLIRSLQGDLDWVAMKCLEKDRTRRYPTANELAMDVRRHIEHEPVLARPPSQIYRLRKLVYRHRGPVAAGLIVALTLVAGIWISSSMAVRARQAEKNAKELRQQESHLRLQAEQERQRAEAGQQAAQLNEYVADMNLAHQSLLAGNYGRAWQLLEKHRPKPGEVDLRGFEWRYLWKLCQGSEHMALADHQAPVDALTLSPAGDLLATLSWESLQVWKLPLNTLVRRLPNSPQAALFLTNGQMLVADRSDIRFWNPVSGAFSPAPIDGAGHLTATTNGHWIAATGRDGLRVWNAADWKLIQFLPEIGGRPVFSSDGSKILGETREGTHIWSTRDWQRMSRLENITNNPFSLGRGPRRGVGGRLFIFSGDGKQVYAPQGTVSERGDFVVRIWDTESGREIGTLPERTEPVEHTSTISSLALSPDGTLLATASFDHSLRLWDLATRRRIATFQGHLNEIFSVAFTPDGRHLISGAKDGAVKIWPVRSSPKAEKLEGNWSPVGFSQDGRLLAVTGRDGSLQVVNLESPNSPPVLQLEGRRGFFPGSSASASRDLRTLVRLGSEGSIEMWDLERREMSSLPAGEKGNDFVHLSADGQKLLHGRRERGMKLLTIGSGKTMALEVESSKGLFSPDGKWVATFSSRNSQVELWESDNGISRAKIEIEGLSPFAGGVFSPDSKMLAVATMENVVMLWEVPSGKSLGVLSGHKQPVFALAFSPDGRTLATSSDDSTVKFWSLATRQELMTIPRVGGGMGSLIFSGDGRLLVGGGSGGISGRGQGQLVIYSAPSLAETEGRK